MEASLLRQASRGASIIISGQALSRLISFAGNVVLVRLMGADALGVSSVELHLLQSACLGLTREGVRRAVLRDAQAPAGLACALAKTYALAGLVILTPLVAAYFAAQPAPSGFSSREYLNSVYLVALSVAVELASEPLFVLAQTEMRYKLRSAIEATSSLARVFGALATHLLLGWRLEAFAAGYVAASVCVLVGYATATSRQGLALVWNEPFLASPSSASPALALDALAMSLQAAWKFVLAEGEGLVMLLLGITTPADQGAFALASNLGALVARLVLQPCEEAAYTVFGRLKPGEELDRALGSLVRAFATFGLVCACLGSHYTHLLVHILYGARWADDTQAPEVLAWYCMYVGVLAVNGITEAFVQAVMDPAQMRELSVWLGVCSLVFLALAAYLVPVMGTPGLVVANSAVMALRSARNVYFAKRTKHSNAHFMPPLATCAALFGAWVTSRYSRDRVYGHHPSMYAAAAHVGIGAVAGLIVLATCVVFDRELVSVLRDVAM